MISFDRDFIKSLIKEKGLSYKRLANIANISLSTIEHIMNNTIKNPRIDTIQAIYSALDINIEHNKKDNRILYIYNQLSEYSKDMLMSYAEYMLENEKGNNIPSFIKMPRNSLKRNKD